MQVSPTVYLKDGALVYRGRYDPSLVAAIKEIPGRSYIPNSKEWSMPVSSDTLAYLERLPQVTITQEARQAVQQQVDAREVVQVAKDTERPEPVAPLPLKDIVPFAHQVTAYNVALTLEESGLLHEQGCGKTITTIAAMGRRFLQGEVKRVLIVAPLSVLPVWETELHDRADFDYELKTLTGAVSKRIEMLKNFKDQQKLHVAVVNYEGYWRKGLFEQIIKWSPDMIIVDESQKIKDSRATQSKGLHKLGDSTRYKMILTGTPVTASPIDFWSQYRFLNPNVFGKSFTAFRNRYAIMGGYLNKQIVGYSNKDELIRKAHSIAHRVKKEDALDLPEQTSQNLYCELEPEAHSIYYQMLKTSVAEIEDLSRDGDSKRLVATNVLTRLLRLQQMVGGFVADPESDDDNPKIIQVSDAKLRLLKEILSDLLYSGKKVVIFVRFIAELNAILKLLESKKINSEEIGYACIYGAIPQSDRGEMVKRFQTDPDCKVFVAQIQTAGLGITLHAADTSIFFSADFNYANYDQCKARLHRIGQKNAVTHIHLVVKGTVDEKIYKSLAAKKSIADDVVDNWRAYF